MVSSSSDSVAYWLSLEVSGYRLRDFDHQGLRCSWVKGLHSGVRACISVVIGVRVSAEAVKIVFDGEEKNSPVIAARLALILACNDIPHM